MPSIQTLVSQTSVVGDYPDVVFPLSDTKRTFHFDPSQDGFTGSITILGSHVSIPGSADYVPLFTVTFTNHRTNLVLEVEADYPYVRARITSATSGSISIYGESSKNKPIGNTGTPSNYTALVTSSLRVYGTGDSFYISAASVPQFTTDDIFYSKNPNFTLTDVLDGGNGAAGKQDKIGNVTAKDADLNLLTGMSTYGLTADDLKKLADISVTAQEINHLTGVTTDLQPLISSLQASIPADFASLTVSAATLNTFFNATVSATISDLNKLSGIQSTAADLNVFAGTAGTFTAADLAKLGNITSSATELNALDGFTGTATDLNKIVGLTSSVGDLNAIQGLSGTGVTANEMQYLSGLSENVQAALNSIPSLTGLTSTVADLNLLTGASAGTGAYAGGPITASEIAYLNGLTGNIQDQLDAKRDKSVTIGINEITGSTITITELNSLSGVTSNIQTQIDNIGLNYLNLSGGQMTGTIKLANGTATAPAIAFAAPDDQTGMYLDSAGSMTFAVTGTDTARINANGFSIQSTAAGKDPLLRKGNTSALASPSFSFVGDDDTGLHRTSANTVALVAGGYAMYKADSDAQVINIGDPTLSIDPVIHFKGKPDVDQMLANVVVDATATGKTTLYKVPTGRTCMITKIMVVLDNVAGFTSNTSMVVNMGFDASFTNLVDNATNTTVFTPSYGFNTAGQIIPITPSAVAAPGTYSVATAGSVIKADVVAPANATTYDLRIILFGFEY